MEIIAKNYQELVLKTPEREIKKIKKIGIFVFLFSFLLLLISCYKSGGNELNCQKMTAGRINCQLKRSQWLGFYPSENQTIDNLEEITFDNEKVMLVTNNNQIYWSPYREHQTRLNNWLNNFNSNPVIRIKYGNIFAQIILILILLGFISVGLQMGQNEGESLIFNKQSKRFTYQYKNLGFRQTFESPFQDIKKFEHKLVSSIDGSKYYVVNLVLNTKNRLNLAQCILLYSSPNETDSLSLLNDIKTFLTQEIG